MNPSKIVLLLSGVFFGGAMDHAIRAALGYDTTPYGYRSGIRGNLVFGAVDLFIAVVLYRAHIHLEGRGVIPDRRIAAELRRAEP
jgi:hypothetical protein